MLAVDKEDDQSGYILELNGFLDFSSLMENSLLCPVQARTNDILIEDTIQKNVTYDSDTVHQPKPDRTKNTKEKTMYHLPELLRITENIISNSCSKYIFNVNCRTEKKYLFHKNYSNK